MIKIHNPIPIDKIGDPYVLYWDGIYYMYATSHVQGFYCWTSRDLDGWSEPVFCYKATERSFGNSMFWAPEVYEFNGKFYMYYTAHWKIYTGELLRIGVAVADHPQGPFKDVYDQQPMFDFGYGVLDANVLKDGEKAYLYYSIAGSNHFVNGDREAQICVVELGRDHVSIQGEAKMILRPEQPWERCQPENHQYWNEGPFVMKHDGLYYMMYSANYYQSPYYGIGYAVARSPWGPFEKYPGNPILQTSDTVSGPGHNSVVKAEDGQYYNVYHAHTHYNCPSEDRQVYITPLVFDHGKLLLRHPDGLPRKSVV